jgi:dTDP-4-dehydrorhamnose 3,5-epimerase-like enzyme
MALSCSNPNYSVMIAAFFESFNQRKFANLTERNDIIMQNNQSFSVNNMLRGLHYQIKYPQGKALAEAELFA